MLAFLTFSLMQSCKKASTDSVTTQTIDATVVSNQTLQLKLGSVSTTQSVSVDNQATHALVSSVKKDFSAGATVYTYIPAANYTGTDQVIIKSVSDTTHSCPNITKATTIYTVNLTVTK